jgi:hypothetical protein
MIISPIAVAAVAVELTQSYEESAEQMRVRWKLGSTPNCSIAIDISSESNRLISRLFVTLPLT